MKVLIVGGGASGMMAALAAAQDQANHVTILERQARVGRKLLATGNGRCNLTNRNLTTENYHGADPGFILPALKALPVEDTLCAFRHLGLLPVAEDTGRVYPLSDQAGSVVDVLRFALDALGVELVCGCEAVSVKKKARGWQVTAVDGQTFFGDKLIVAAGGCAGGKLGGTTGGYRLLEQLGHSCTSLHPSLVQLKTEPTWVRALKGVRADGRAVLKVGGRVAVTSQGEFQFTDFGLSGPAAFELSRAVSTGKGEMTVLLDFLRAYNNAQLTELLQERRARFPNLPAEELLTGILQTRLGKTIVRRAGLSLTVPLSSLTDVDLKAALAMTRCYPLEVTGTMGMDAAQVTAGGVNTAEFRPDTLESRLAPGVFACGEVLDIDGDCGGYNLQWAWSSGHLAGKLGKP